MNCLIKPIMAQAFILFSAFAISTETSAATFAAKVSHIQGKPGVINKGQKTKLPLKLGTSLSQGDRIITGSGGRVEILFGSGATILLDYNSDFTITTMAQKPSGAISAFFSLAFGRIKSTFSKVMPEDRVMYKTKAALAGIAGTPVHIIEALHNTGEAGLTKVYLLGEPGDEGSLFVEGSDPSKTRVLLYAGQETSVIHGMAPAKPKSLSPELIKRLKELKTPGPSSGLGASATSAASANPEASKVVLGGLAVLGGGAALASNASESKKELSGGPTSGDGQTGGAGEDKPFTGSWSQSVTWTWPDHSASAGFSCSVTESEDTVTFSCSNGSVTWRKEGDRITHSAGDHRYGDCPNVTKNKVEIICSCESQVTSISGDSNQVVEVFNQWNTSCPADPSDWSWTVTRVFTKN